MDFICCPIRNFRCIDYKEPIEIKQVDKHIFYLLYQDMELINVMNSYMYKEFYGLDGLSHYSNEFIAYSKGENMPKDERSRQIIANNFYCSCQLFSTALWFIKDNAVTPRWTTISSNEQINPGILRRSIYYTNSMGGYDICEFTKEDLMEAMNWYNILEELSIKIKNDSVDISNNLTNMSNYISFNVPSFQRAIFYLDNARKTEFLPAKIASYISLLETLFAVYGENTHKVSERAAFLIGENSEERISIYYNVKYCYDIRSWYVHGKKINDDKKEGFPEYCTIIDNIIRSVLKKMLVEHKDLNYSSQNQAEKVDKWFNEYILGRK